ncbi:Beta-cyclopiazonate dehydrogenase [Penicillium subrubescens]|uniref:Beta-cyclopiazonate dehydrogenase n=2 Tax=Penicillium subrubescens TaxID=1316194 RepID=A0A1Q5UND1_9EURO|nr:Beta-cyclopiazonate dehydrogenase [Penicillium subrubescens]
MIMFSPSSKTIALLGLLAHASFVYSQPDALIRDVAIIGGGASGTFAAIRLRNEGKSTILIEKEAILGGHTNTYQDPVTKVNVDYGVEVFHNQEVVKDYFNKLNVSWAIASDFGGVGTPVYLDGNTAQKIAYTSPDPRAGLYAYATHLAQYAQLEYGFFLPEPVPEDLLLPFGAFLDKYPDIGNAAFTIFRFGQGLGDFLSQPTLYVFKNFGLDIIQDISTGFLVVTSQNNYEIYDHATKILGSDVLLSSTVVSTRHRDQKGGVLLEVQTPSGRRIVKAKSLLITIPPKLGNLRAFDLDDRETALFGAFQNTGYYTSLVKNTGLPAGFSSLSVGADTPYNIPDLPGVYTVDSTAIEGVFDIKYGSPHGLSDDFVRGEILSYVKKLQANGFAEKVPGEPEFVRFNSHTPFELTVSQDLISGGFYERLYGLQGYRGTWYTGAAFHTQDSSMLWNYTDSYVLPSMLSWLK